MNNEGLQAPHALHNVENFFTLLCVYFAFCPWLHGPLFLVSTHVDHLLDIIVSHIKKNTLFM